MRQIQTTNNANNTSLASTDKEIYNDSKESSSSRRNNEALILKAPPKNATGYLSEQTPRSYLETKGNALIKLFPGQMVTTDLLRLNTESANKLNSILVDLSRQTTSPQRDKLLLAAFCTIIARRTINLPSVTSAFDAVLKTLSDDTSTDISGTTSVNIAAERTTVRLALVLLTNIIEELPYIDVRNMLAQLATNASNIHMRRIAIKMYALHIRRQQACKGNEISKDDVTSLMKIIEDVSGLEVNQKLQTIHYKFNQGGSMRNIRGKRKEVLEKINNIQILLSAGYSASRIVFQSFPNFHRDLAINAIKSASLGSGISIEDPVAARHAMALVAARAKSDPHEIVEAFSMFVEGTLNLYSHGSFGSTNYQQQQLSKSKSINMSDVLCRVFVCRTLGALIATDFSNYTFVSSSARKLLQLIATLDCEVCSALSACSALVGEKCNSALRAKMYRQLVADVSTFALMNDRLLTHLKSKKQTDITGASRVIEEIAVSALWSGGHYWSGNDGCSLIFAQLRHILTNSSSPFITFAAAAALIFIPMDSKTTEQVFLTIAQVAIGSFKCSSSATLSSTQISSQSSCAWNQDLLVQLLTKLRTRVSIRGSLVVENVLEVAKVLCFHVPWLLTSFTELVHLWNTVAAIPKCSGILLTHLYDIYHKSSRGDTSRSSNLHNVDIPSTVTVPAETLVNAELSLTNTVLWFLGENANYICSLYAWDDTEKTQEISYTDRTSFYNISNACNAEFHRVIIFMVSAMNNTSWTGRISAATALSKIAVRSYEPYRFYCYNALRYANQGLNICQAVSPAVVWLDTVYRRHEQLQNLLNEIDSVRLMDEGTLNKICTWHNELIDAAAKICFVPQNMMLPLGRNSLEILNEARLRRGECIDQTTIESKSHRGRVDSNNFISEFPTEEVLSTKSFTSNRSVDHFVSQFETENRCTQSSFFVDTTEDFKDERTPQIEAYQPPSETNQCQFDVELRNINHYSTSCESTPKALPANVDSNEETSLPHSQSVMFVHHRFESNFLNELTVGVGETVHALHISDDGKWTWVQRSGMFGFVPSQALQNTHLLSDIDLLMPQSYKTAIEFSGRTPATVLYDFVSTMDGELSVMRGDKVLVESYAGKGWLFVKHVLTNEKSKMIDSTMAEGLVPTGYLLQYE